MGGDSAGGHLSVVTTYHLLKTRPKFGFKGLVLNYGAYDLSGFLPQAWHFDLPLVLDADIMTKFISSLSHSIEWRVVLTGTGTPRRTARTQRRLRGVIR